MNKIRSCQVLSYSGLFRYAIIKTISILVIIKLVVPLQLPLTIQIKKYTYYDNDTCNNDNNDNTFNNKESRFNINNNFKPFALVTVLNLKKNVSSPLCSIIGISQTWLHANSPDIYKTPKCNMIHANRKKMWPCFIYS